VWCGLEVDLLLSFMDVIVFEAKVRGGILPFYSMGVDSADTVFGGDLLTAHTYSHITRPGSNTVTRLFQ
jgi:hypothetical protein